jgi:nicotinamide-nucleotide amidase|tara:strand:- start:2436 stop:2921 length:486 start_codon:yes stop_codon:yes gene_type:complete
MTKQIVELINDLAVLLSEKQLKVCTAESCTGGLIAKSFTDLPGSSAWFERGFVTYSNESKIEMLGVSGSIIDYYGAVSEPVATAMAVGALKHSHADYSIAVTGVAGPGGGSAEKPVGTVWIGIANQSETRTQKFLFDGNREMVRLLTMRTVIKQLLPFVES